MKKPKVCVVIPSYGEQSTWKQAALSVPDSCSVFVCFNDGRSLDGEDYSLADTKGIEMCSLPASGYETGALVQAFKVFSGVDYYLLMHDSCTLRPDGVDLFLEKMGDKNQAIAWLTFPLFFDNQQQQDWVLSHVLMRKDIADGECSEGIFGSILMISRTAIETLYDKDLFPTVPTEKLHSTGSERLWPIVLTAAGIPWETLHPLEWSNARLEEGYSAISKRLMGRS